MKKHSTALPAAGAIFRFHDGVIQRARTAVFIPVPVQSQGRLLRNPLNGHRRGDNHPRTVRSFDTHGGPAGSPSRAAHRHLQRSDRRRSRCLGNES